MPSSYGDSVRSSTRADAPRRTGPLAYLEKLITPCFGENTFGVKQSTTNCSIRNPAEVPYFCPYAAAQKEGDAAEFLRQNTFDGVRYVAKDIGPGFTATNVFLNVARKPVSEIN